MPVTSVAGERRLAEYLTEPLEVGEPDVVGPLAVYPITGGVCRQRFVAFSQAPKGQVTIGELDGAASVNDLVVTNLGKVPVLLYEGEEILGGQQNRSLDVTVLVAANAKLPMPVSCVEAGRWDHRAHRSQFAASSHSPPPELRRSKSNSARRRAEAGVAARADQGEVWGLVDNLAGRLGRRSPTRALSDSYEHRRADLHDIAGGIRLRDGQVGALVAVGEEFCVIDFVARPDVFATLHEPLVQGYALEALATEKPERPAPSIDRGRELVAAAVNAPTEQRPSIGLGTDVRFAANGIAGAALVHEDELVQLTAFPDEGDGERKPRVRSRIRRPSRRRSSS